MDNKSFWLANIGTDSLSVSLVTFASSKYHVTAIGKDVLYQSSVDSFVAAIDQSLSGSAESVSLPESDEPNSIALIISPFWVGSDGKIMPDKLKLFESMFKELKLSPMGFISFDEAIVEEANISDGFPASFITVYIDATSMIISLAYLGKVIERLTKPISDYFNPSQLESALLEFNTDSALPPQIILLGEVTDEIKENIKNYLWIGKKDIETFLHFPEIKNYSTLELTTIYTKAITSQFEPPSVTPEDNAAEAEPVDEMVDDEPIVEKTLDEVAADDLGFTEADNFTIPETIPEEVTTIITPPKKSFKFAFPKISFPKFSLPTANYLLYPLVLSPLLILIPFYFTTAKITLYLTPYKYSKTISVTLDPTVAAINVDKKIIPVIREIKTIDNSATLATTGQKIVGQKAQGELTVFNKQDKVQSLPKGAVLIDSRGNKFELLSQVQVASSSSDLALGIINLGQVKVMAAAVDIGPEYNLNKDELLNFKDFASTTLQAKVSSAFTGGTKNEVRAVAAADKTNIETKINSQISSIAADKTQNVLAVITKNSRVDFNREVGEEADELTATIQTTIYTYSFSPDQKDSIIKQFMADEPGFKDTAYNPNNYTLTLNSTKNTIDKLTGQLTLDGQSTPSVDRVSLAKSISGKFNVSASDIIKNHPRVYNYKILTNFPLVPLPFRLSNISFDIK